MKQKLIKTILLSILPFSLLFNFSCNNRYHSTADVQYIWDGKIVFNNSSETYFIKGEIISSFNDVYYNNEKVVLTKIKVEKNMYDGEKVVDLSDNEYVYVPFQTIYQNDKGSKVNLENDIMESYSVGNRIYLYIEYYSLEDMRNNITNYQFDKNEKSFVSKIDTIAHVYYHLIIKDHKIDNSLMLNSLLTNKINY
jgi:hypothetical protein